MRAEAHACALRSLLSFTFIITLTFWVCNINIKRPADVLIATWSTGDKMY